MCMENTRHENQQNLSTTIQQCIGHVCDGVGNQLSPLFVCMYRFHWFIEATKQLVKCDQKCSGEKKITVRVATLKIIYKYIYKNINGV